MLFENEEAEFKLPFGQEEKAVGSSEEEEDEEAEAREVEEKKPGTKAGSGGFMSKFSLAGITVVYINILSKIIIIIVNSIILFSKLNL